MKYNKFAITLLLRLTSPSQAFIPTRVLFRATGQSTELSVALQLYPGDDPSSDWGEEASENDDIIDATNCLLDSTVDPESITAEALDDIFPLMLWWCRIESEEAAFKVEQLLNLIEYQAEAGNDLPKPLCKYFTLAVDAWGKSGQTSKAQKVLSRMTELGKSDPELAPTRATYNAMMNAYSRQGNVEETEHILVFIENAPGLEPITNDYNVLLSTYAKVGQARKAQGLLNQMIDKCQQQQADDECTVSPDLYSYNMLLDAWAKSTESGRGKRAEDILSTLESKYISGELKWGPDARSYSAVIIAVVRSGEPKSVERAEKIWAQAEAVAMDSDAYVLSALLDAYASSDAPGCAERAEAILEKLAIDSLANQVAYNTVLKAWKSRESGDAIVRAERLFQRMQSIGLADTFSYCTLIALYATKGNIESAERAEELLHHMDKDGLKPNVQTLNAVMNAWIRCGKVHRAERILEEMERSFYAGGSEVRIAPNVVSYTTVMNGWVKSGNELAMDKTKDIFDRMTSMCKSGNEDARPNLVSYVTLINSIVKSNDIKAAEKAEKTLFEMYRTYKVGEIDQPPNAQLVTSVIDCWQKSGERDAGERAEKLLDWMLQTYQEERDDSLQPNEFSFNSAISAWARSRKFGKAARARALLLKMSELNKSGTISAAPNAHCYTAVINSCAYCENDPLEKREALKIAVETYKEMIDTLPGGPNQVTFTTMMTALSHLIPASEKRAAAVGTIFKKCAEEGHVSDVLMRRVQSMLSVNQLKDLMGEKSLSAEGKVDIMLVPVEWKRNAGSNAPRKRPQSRTTS